MREVVCCAQSSGEYVHLGQRILQLLRSTGQHGRIHDPGSNRVHADTGAGQITGQRQCEADDSALRGRVGRLADLAFVGCYRGHVDDGAAFSALVRFIPAHDAGDPTKHIKHSDQVDLDGESEAIEWKQFTFPGDYPVGSHDSGRADEEIDLAVGRLGPGYGPGDLFGIAHICGHKDGPRSHALGNCRAVRRRQVENGDLAASRRERFSRTPAQSRCSTCDQCNRTLDTHNAPPCTRGFDATSRRIC